VPNVPGRTNESLSTIATALVPPEMLRQIRPGDALCIHGTLQPIYLQTHRYWTDKELRKRAEGLTEDPLETNGTSTLVDSLDAFAHSAPSTLLAKTPPSMSPLTSAEFKSETTRRLFQRVNFCSRMLSIVETSADQWTKFQEAIHLLADGRDPLARSEVDFCRIYDATTPTDDSHNCIGCNLKDLAEEIREAVDLLLDQATPSSSIRTSAKYRVVFGLLNSLWEQLRDCFILIQLAPAYQTKEHFPTFFQIRRWTNFFKHPGPFAYMMHHPTFVQDGTAEAVKAKLDQGGDGLVLGDPYVFDYFSADPDPAKAKKHIEELRKGSTAVVVLPNLSTISEGLLTEVERALDLLCVDLFSEELRKKSTIESFYCRPLDT
jgi:hypothetical protein